MSDIKIRVNNVSKSYNKYKSEFFRFLSWFGFKSSSIDQSTVLSNINFTLNKGEAVALVGENGAGKSTLLKIIAGTVNASVGSVSVNGSVSAILELGLGFNPEMTGRQNVYLSAGVMGFTEKSIADMIGDICEFSELGQYFDQPVRTYSSGMHMRLAFSIATSVRPAILIIDEALSVGDTYFQHKSFNKIKAFREKGTTLLFVSHDRGAVQALCNRAILLEQGCIIRDGSPEDVMDFYNAIIAEKKSVSTIQENKLPNGRIQTISGTGAANVVKISIKNVDGEVIEVVKVGEEVELEVEVKANESMDSLVLGFLIKSRLGIDVFGTNSFYTDNILNNVNANDKFVFNIKFKANFGIGSYSISTALASSYSHIENNYEWKDLALTFTVINVDKPEFVGLLWSGCEVKVQKLNVEQLV
jgi:lipopolysaccharide transport system ATP-binding protein